MMDIFMILLGVISIGIIIFFLKRDSKSTAQKFTDSDQDIYSSQDQHLDKVDQEKDHKEASNTTGVNPESNQQRNLDREVGGLEESEDLAPDNVDPWENRSDEIDREGSIDQLGSTGKKSMIWRNKKGKLDAADKMENMTSEEVSKMNSKQGSGLDFNSNAGNQSGFGQMIKARQDLGNNQGGGISL